jgi:hypothetical protein
MQLSDYDGDFVSWEQSLEYQRRLFLDEELPIHPNHAERIRVLKGRRSRELRWLFLQSLPARQISTDSFGFRHEEHICLHDVWGNLEKIQQVKDWLYQRGIPFTTQVYLVYDDEYGLVVKTDWKTIVIYWDNFAWDVGYQLFILDATRTWLCRFHHEDIIIFEHQ